MATGEKILKAGTAMLKAATLVFVAGAALIFVAIAIGLLVIDYPDGVNPRRFGLPVTGLIALISFLVGGVWLMLAIRARKATARFRLEQDAASVRRERAMQLGGAAGQLMEAHSDAVAGNLSVEASAGSLGLAEAGPASEAAAVPKTVR